MARDAPDIWHFFAPPPTPSVAQAQTAPADATATAPPATPPHSHPPSSGLAAPPPPAPRTFAKRKKPEATVKDTHALSEAAAPPPTRPPPPRPPRLAVQTHLDLGQASFHSTTCPDCGLLYAPGDPADEALHRVHHAAAVKGPRVGPGGSVRVVREGVAAQPPSARRGSSALSSTSGRILHAPPGRRPAAVAAAIARAEAALGTPPGFTDPRGGKSTHVLLYEAASDRRVAGVAVVEALPRGCRVTRWKSENGSPPRTRPAAGVRAVWVAADHRRAGIASALLDAGRDVVAPLARVPRGALAFSAPTDEGAALAAAYTGEAGFGVYECVEG